MLPRFRVQRLGLKNGVKRVLFNSVKSNKLHFGTYTAEGDDEDIRTDGRNTKNHGRPFLSRRVVQIYACFLSGHTFAL